MKRTLALLAVACGACQSTIVYEAPARDESGSLFLLASGAGDELVYASDIAGGFNPPLPELAAVDDLQLSAARYRCALAELDMPRGPIALGALTAPLAQPAAIDSYRDGAWQEARDDSAVRMTLARLPWRSSCAYAPRLELDETQIDLDQDTRTMVALPDDRIFIVSNANELLIAANSALVDRAMTSTAVQTMARVPDGRIALVTNQGTVFFAAVVDALAPDRWQRVPSVFAPAQNDLVDFALAPRPRAGSIELLAATSAHTIDYFDGQSWIRLIEDLAPYDRVDIAWIDSEDAVVVGLGGSNVVYQVHADSRTAVRATIDGVPENCSLTSVAAVPGLGYAYGTCKRVLIGDQVIDAPVGEYVLFVTPLGEGRFLATGHDGYVLFDARARDCESELNATSLFVKEVVALENGVFMTGGVVVRKARTFRLLPAERERPSCQLMVEP